MILAAALSIAGVAVIYWHFFAEGDDARHILWNLQGFVKTQHLMGGVILLGFIC